MDERKQPGERTDLQTSEKMPFKVRFERAQGGCLTERQKEFVFQSEGPKMEKEREPTVESLNRGILRLKAPDLERRA